MIGRFLFEIDIEQIAQLPTDVHTVVEPDPARAIDENPKYPAAGFALILHMDKLQALGFAQRFGDLPHLLDDGLLTRLGKRGAPTGRSGRTLFSLRCFGALTNSPCRTCPFQKKQKRAKARLIAWMPVV